MNDTKPKVEVIDTVSDLAWVVSRARAVVDAYRAGGNGPYNQKGRAELAWAITTLESAVENVSKPREVKG